MAGPTSYLWTGYVPEGYTAEQVAEADRLIDEGRALLKQGEYSQSVTVFQRAVECCPLPAGRNNLALLYLIHCRDPKAALEVLHPNLQNESGFVQPFARALAARCYVAMGEQQKARQLIEAAIDDFELGLRVDKDLRNHTGWREYTAAILEAAGEVGDHRLVWTCYQRWLPYHVLPQSHFYGGIAAFNLGRYQQAVTAWRRARSRDWRIVEAYIEVGGLVDTGLIPPYTLPYHLPSIDELEKAVNNPGATPDVDAVVNRIVADKGHLTVMLSSIFSKRTRNLEEVISHLVAAAGEWGDQFAASLLQTARVPDNWKLAAAQGLIKKGALTPGKPVTMFIAGRKRDVLVFSAKIDFDADPESEKLHAEAISLRDAGQLQKAKQLLEELIFKRTRVWASAIVTYADLLRREGNLEGARSWLEVIHGIVPDDPVILFNLAALSLQERNAIKAWEYFERIDPKSLPEEFREMYAEAAEMFGAIGTAVKGRTPADSRR